MKSCSRFLLVFFVLLTLSPSRGRADSITGLAVGAALSSLMDQVNTAIISARNAGNSVAKEAGRDVAIAISNAQNAYTNGLNKTFDDHLDPTIRGTIDQLQSAVNDFSTNTNASLQDATAREQQVVNALPFRQHEPQLTKVSPRFVVPAKALYPVMVKFSGNFEFAAQQNFVPTLSVRTKSYKPISSNTQELVFSVPVSDLFKSDSAPKQFQYATGTLVVP